MNSYSLYTGVERRFNNPAVYRGRERRSQTYSRPIVNEEQYLVKRAAAHDNEAFARLYDRYVDKIYKYVYYKVGNKPEAEDLTAQAFLKAWESIGAYRITERPFSAWLYRIAHNLVVDYFRAHREITSLDQSPPVEEKANLEELTQQHLTAETLRRAIARLTSDQQQVIILRFLEGHSTDQVAAIMGKQPGAVRTLQHRALHALNAIFQKGSEKL